MAAFKHPFVLRRLFVMLPTLFIISVCVFTIIQLPPGDYLDTQIRKWELDGVSTEVIEQKVAVVEEYFHLEEPVWKRYSRWMGFTWFVTYDSADKGLLQGHMGRSMREPFRSVNDLIGDRLLLTILISLGTIIFTWILAIPIGIYSACRQYSVGDYTFTFLGFIGMSIPSFLFALVFMCVLGISGLFSAQYLIQPYWNLAKVVDLLKHIWVPILIMGIGSTASMIRIMRANLLDELHKPYVTTAKAKGVGPLRLLFKYPVRIALNPFVSGLGGYFPQLVSGGAVVAIVLTLPTIGPLMYTSLFDQDMFLAGSILMLLSTLTVIGTLVSDLVLLVLDPRIRLGGDKS